MKELGKTCFGPMIGLQSPLMARDQRNSNTLYLSPRLVATFLPNFQILRTRDIINIYSNGSLSGFVSAAGLIVIGADS